MHLANEQLDLIELQKELEILGMTEEQMCAAADAYYESIEASKRSQAAYRARTQAEKEKREREEAVKAAARASSYIGESRKLGCTLLDETIV